MQKNSFVLFHEIRPILELLSDEERGQLFLALLNYSEFGEIPAFTGALNMAFLIIQGSMDRMYEKWEETCRRRSEAGKKSAALRAAKKADSASDDASGARQSLLGNSD